METGHIGHLLLAMNGTETAATMRERENILLCECVDKRMKGVCGL